MSEEKKLLSIKENTVENLMSNNLRGIEDYNEKTLSALLLMGWVLILLPLMAVPFSNTKAGAIPAYLLTFATFLALFFLYKVPSIKKHTLTGAYISFSVLFLLGIYLSVIHSPNMRATILLGGFILMPLTFIDRLHRTILFLALWLVVHTLVAYYLKPLLALDDTINCLIAAVLGCYLGNTLMRVRLESFEARRLLVIEKETDELTGLPNRRKLFETLMMIQGSDAEKPTGIMMLDIDHFKDFNDKYGHISGDRCLRLFAEVLTNFTKAFRLHFYRYGGEEFVAIAYGYDQDDLFSIAESLRVAVQRAEMEGYSTTVSIGVAYCGEEQVRNYEKVLERADNAAYAAKRSGRNNVFMEKSIGE